MHHPVSPLCAHLKPTSPPVCSRSKSRPVSSSRRLSAPRHPSRTLHAYWGSPTCAAAERRKQWGEHLSGVCGAQSHLLRTAPQPLPCTAPPLPLPSHAAAVPSLGGSAHTCREGSLPCRCHQDPRPSRAVYDRGIRIYCRLGRCSTHHIQLVVAYLHQVSVMNTTS